MKDVKKLMRVNLQPGEQKRAGITQKLFGVTNPLMDHEWIKEEKIIWRD